MQPLVRTFNDEHGQLGLVGWVVTFVVLGALVAVPYVYLGRSRVEQVQQGLGHVAQANDASAEALLITASQGAKVFFVEQGSLAGYGPAQAASFDPQTAFDSSSTATSGHVSIRGADGTSVVLVTLGGSGPMCVGLEGDAISFGRTDAVNASQCTGADWS